MSSLSEICVVLAGAALLLSIPACTTGPEETSASAEANLGTVDPSAVAGALASGETSAPIAYSGSPRYRALSFVGHAGDRADAWVRSIDGDALAWITDEEFKSLAVNDDGGPTTHDAHVSALLPKDAPYYIVFRERDYERATFTVSLSTGAGAGTPCATADQVLTRACGMCGTQQAICLRDPSGALRLSPFGVCQNEAGECFPGTTESEACGTCGARSVTCTNACRWAVGACATPPSATCVPGSYDLTNAGCVDPMTYRVRQCSATCSSGSFGACAAPPTTVEVAGTVGTQSSTIVVLDGSLPTAPSTTCPQPALAATSSVYGYTQIHNPHATPMTVSVFHSVAPGASILDTVMAVYASPTAPDTADERKACLRAASSGNATLTGDARFASIDVVSRRVTIPAGATFTVYSAAERPTVGKTPVRLTVRTESVGP